MQDGPVGERLFFVMLPKVDYDSHNLSFLYGKNGAGCAPFCAGERGEREYLCGI